VTTDTFVEYVKVLAGQLRPWQVVVMDDRGGGFPSARRHTGRGALIT
jgi:hypothetical protein